MHSSKIVIGYGNDLRADDGVGREAAEILLRMQSDGLMDADTLIISCHQLLPEHSLLLSSAGVAVFIDATKSNKSEVKVEEVVASEEKGDEESLAFLHSFSPETLLISSKKLFGHSPKAYLITIGCDDFSLSEKLSEGAKTSALQAAALTVQILEKASLHVV